MTERTVEETLQELPDGTDVTLRLKDGTEVAAQVESAEDGVHVMADGDQMDVAEVEDVFLEGSTDGPE